MALSWRVGPGKHTQVQIVVADHVGAVMRTHQTTGRAQNARAPQAQCLQPRYGEIADAAQGGLRRRSN